MTARLDTIPEYDYSDDFSYANWTPGTNITLSRVPWTADYRDIVDFSTDAELDAYVRRNSGPEAEFDRTTYVRVGAPIRLPIPFNDAYQWNYMRVHNPRQPVGESGPRTFYYFILDVRHVAPNTTEFIVQLDVWNSFRRYVEFGNAFVERGHVGIADIHNFYDNGRVLLAQPEGFDLGNEYSVDAVYRKKYGSARAKEAQGFDIIIYSTVMLHSDPGDVGNPRFQTAQGSRWENLPNGATAYLVPHEEFDKTMEYLSQYPWLSQGIVSIQAVPPGIVPDSLTRDVAAPGGAQVVFHIINRTRVEPKNVILAKKWRDDYKKVRLTGRYRHLTKFLTYPYSIVEVTTYTGTPLVLKPECVDGDDLVMTELAHLAQPSPRIAFVPQHYNRGAGRPDTEELFESDDGSEFLDMQTGFFNFPTFSLTNNSYISFMASNAHSIAYQHNSADWSQQKALSGNSMSYDNANTAMGLQNDQLNIQRSAEIQQYNNSMRGAMAQSTLSGVTDILTKGPAGAVGAFTGLGSTALSQHTASRGLDISQDAAMRSNAASIGAQSTYRDRNKEYSDWAAKGDYANAIGAINAKTQDAKMLQPTTSGQLGGEAFNLAVHGWVLSAKVKTVQGGAFRAIGEYWLRYGYAINRFYDMGNALSVMTNFTYWRCKEMYVMGSRCPEMFRNTIRGIFEKGVTVWKNPDQIGRIDVGENDPIKESYLNLTEFVVDPINPITWGDVDDSGSGFDEWWNNPVGTGGK